MPHFTSQMTFRQIFAEPRFAGWQAMLDYRRNGMHPWADGVTLEQFGEKTGWPVGRMLESLEFVYQRCGEGQVFYPLDEAGGKETCLAAFPLEKEAPFVMVVPGGGYGAVCSLIDGYSYAKQLNAMGYGAFVLNYRVNPHKYPAPQEDLARAVRFVLERSAHFRVIPQNYAVMGFSAGGHLAASFGVPALGYQAYGLPKPGSLILCYPVVTMLPPHAAEGSVQAFLSEQQRQDPAMMEALSLENRITPDYPPAFLWQCQTDPAVPSANSRMLQQALADNGVEHVYEQPPYVGHGLPEDALPEHRDWLSRAVAFWQQF